MEDFLSALTKQIQLPKMAKVRQIFDRPQLASVEQEVLAQLDTPKIAATLCPGSTIAITAGSRGIANMPLILKTVVDFVKQAGCEPFLFPAMGSHGGATAEGQRHVLQSLGITSETMGAPIRCGVEVTQICRLDDGTPVFIDKFAAEADGIILVNRIKPHTAFRNLHESGLVKMAVIGMGKQMGAEICHRRGWGCMAENIEKISMGIFQYANILFGVGVIENAYDETCKVIALPKDEILSQEPALLQEARSLMASIRFPEFDVLVVDQIGKNISGDGMDPNITGTYFTPYASGGPRKENVVILDLTEESHGCAIGIGAAAVTTKRFFDKINFANTYPNCLTSKVLDVCKIPLIARCDKEALAAAIYACALADRDNMKIVRIKDSLHVGEVYISEALYEEALQNPDIEILTEPEDMIFNAYGNLF